MQTFNLVDGDIQINKATGRPIMLQGTAKFTQDVKIALDIIANLDSLVATVSDTFSMRAEISSRLTDAFALYASQQNSIQRNTRPNNETYSKTAQISVTPVYNSVAGNLVSTAYAYRVDVLSVNATNPTTVTGTLT